MDHVDSTSDSRIVNNVLRHEYRVLTDDEKAKVKRIKDMGLEFIKYIDEISVGNYGAYETSIAKQRVEEAVMWAVKYITA